jgi:integrase
VRAVLPERLELGPLEIDGDIVLDRRSEKHDQTRSMSLASLERPWERRDAALRERTLRRLLYETAARTDAVLRLNVEDLDVAGKRVRTRSNGGDTDWLFFGSAIAFVSGAAPRLRALRRRRSAPPTQTPDECHAAERGHGTGLYCLTAWRSGVRQSGPWAPGLGECRKPSGLVGRV